MCVCVTGHGDWQQLYNPQVEPQLNQHYGPDQQDKVDVAGSVGAFLPLEEASWQCAGAPREARRGRNGAHRLSAVFRGRVGVTAWRR